MSVSNRSSIPMSLLGTYSLGCVALCLSILCLIATKRFGNGWRRCKKTDTVGSKNSADAARLAQPSRSARSSSRRAFNISTPSSTPILSFHSSK